MKAKDLWYQWPRDNLGRLVINSGGESHQLAAIVANYPHARRMIEKRLSVLDRAVEVVQGQAHYKLDYGIKLATEAQLLREILNAAFRRPEEGGEEIVTPQAD